MTSSDLDLDTVKIVAKYLSAFPSKNALNGFLQDIDTHLNRLDNGQQMRNELLTKYKWTGDTEQMTLGEALVLENTTPSNRLENIIKQCTLVSQFHQDNTGAHIKRDPLLSGPSSLIAGIYSKVKSSDNYSLLQYIESSRLGSRLHLMYDHYQVLNFSRLYEQQTVVKGHFSAPYNGIFDRTGSVFITGGDDGLIKIWDANSAYLMRSLRGHSTHRLRDNIVEDIYVIQDISISADNSRLATASYDGTVQIWNTINWEPMTSLKVTKEITTVKLSTASDTDLNSVIVTGKDGKTRVFYYLPDKEEYHTEPIILNTFEKRTDVVSCSAFNFSGTIFAIGGTSGIYVYRLSPKKWNKLSKEKLALVENTPLDSPEPAFHLLRIYVECGHGSVVGQVKSKNGTTKLNISEIAFCNSNNSFSTSCFDGTIILFEFDNDARTWKKNVLDNPIKSVHNTAVTIPDSNGSIDDDELDEFAAYTLEWNCNDDILAVSVGIGHIVIFNARTKKPFHTLSEHHNIIYVLNFHPKNPRILLSASRDGFLMLWDVISGKCLNKFDVGYGLLSAVFSPDGSKICATDMEGCQYFYGVGNIDRIYPNCFEQFFSVDFQHVIRQNDGTLLDTTMNTEPHLVPLGDLLDSRQSPYYIPQAKLRDLYKLDRGLENQDAAVLKELDRKSRALEDESKISTMLLPEKPLYVKKVPEAVYTAKDTPETPSDVDDIPFMYNNYSSGDEYQEDDDDDVLNSSSSSNSSEDGENESSSGSEFSDISYKRKTTNNRKRKPPVKRESPQRIVRSRRTRGRETDSDQSDFIVDSDYENGEGSRPRRNVRRKKLALSDSDSEFSSDDSEEINIDLYTDSSEEETKRKNVKKPPKKKEISLVEPEVPIGITEPSSWLSQVESEGLFLPQVGDILVYSKTGHKKFNEKALELGYYVRTKVDETMPKVNYCKVHSIQYFPGTNITCVVHLCRMEPHADVSDHLELITPETLQAVESRGKIHYFDVHIWDLENIPDFFVPLKQYIYCESQKLQVGYEVQAKFDDQFWVGEIIEETSGNDPYEKFKVSWNSGGEDWLSPWELYLIPPKSFSFSVMKRNVSKAIQNIVSRWNTVEEVKQFFREQVDYEQYPDYLVVNPYPVWTNLILQRLSSMYYRTKDAVIWDVYMLIENAKRYNDDGSYLNEFASNDLEEMKKEIETIVD